MRLLQRFYLGGPAHEFRGRNDKATFYTDTMESSHMRGRRSIVPYVVLTDLISSRSTLTFHSFSCANILGGGSRYGSSVCSQLSVSELMGFIVSTSRCIQELRDLTGVSVSEYI